MDGRPECLGEAGLAKREAGVPVIGEKKEKEQNQEEERKRPVYSFPAGPLSSPVVSSIVPHHNRARLIILKTTD